MACSIKRFDKLLTVLFSSFALSCKASKSSGSKYMVVLGFWVGTSVASVLMGIVHYSPSQDSLCHLSTLPVDIVHYL